MDYPAFLSMVATGQENIRIARRNQPFIYFNTLVSDDTLISSNIKETSPFFFIHSPNIVNNI